MGQSVLDGHLPYTELWDIKPPLAFVSYGLLIGLLGKSIISIRLGGAISVFLTSWLVYAIAENIWRRRAGILAATLFILLSALMPDGQATMTEHMALLPLMAGLAVLVLNRSTLIVLLVAGILLTIATLIRLNLAYVVVSVGFWILLSHFKPKLKTLWRVLAYCGGSFGTILLTYIPYLVTGNGKIWLSSVILAPLGYSSSQQNVWKTFQAQINFILASISPLQEINNLLPDRSIVPEFLLPARELPVELVGISLLVWLAGLGGAFIIIKQWKSLPPIKKQQLILLATFFLGTEISIIRSGASYDHYFIQVIPFFALTAAYFWDEQLRKKSRFLTTMAIAFLLSLSLKLILAQYQVIGDRLLARQPLNYGAGYEIADYLRQNNPTQEPVYMMSDHIVYWFLDLKPISKSTTHPSNIAKEYLLEHIPNSHPLTTAELARVLAIQPKFIIKPKQLGYIKEDSPSGLLLTNVLTTQYQIVGEIQGREIHRIVLFP